MLSIRDRTESPLPARQTRQSSDPRCRRVERACVYERIRITTWTHLLQVLVRVWRFLQVFWGISTTRELMLSVSSKLQQFHRLCYWSGSQRVGGPSSKPPFGVFARWGWRELSPLVLIKGKHIVCVCLCVCWQVRSPRSVFRGWIIRLIWEKSKTERLFK